jgi:hypothetical protein
MVGSAICVRTAADIEKALTLQEERCWRRPVAHVRAEIGNGAAPTLAELATLAAAQETGTVEILLVSSAARNSHVVVLLREVGPDRE